MKFFKKLFGQGTAGNRSPGNPPGDSADSYVKACFEMTFKEQEDKRWFTQFPELKAIDDLRTRKEPSEALRYALRGVAGYPDSFLFYCRAGECYDALGQAESAEKILLEGLGQSLSTAPICGALADRAFKAKALPEAAKWWIRAAVVQMDSGIARDGMPFLNMACLASELKLPEPGKYLTEMADRVSAIGPVRLDGEALKLRREAARDLDGKTAKSIKAAIILLCRRCETSPVFSR